MVIATDLITSPETHRTSVTTKLLQSLWRLTNIFSFLGFICLHYFKLLEIIKGNCSSSISSWPFWMRTAIKENTAAFQIFMTVSGWLFLQQLASFLMIPLSVCLVVFFSSNPLVFRSVLSAKEIHSRSSTIHLLSKTGKNWIARFMKITS